MGLSMKTFYVFADKPKVFSLKYDFFLEISAAFRLANILAVLSCGEMKAL